MVQITNASKSHSIASVLKVVEIIGAFNGLALSDCSNEL